MSPSIKKLIFWIAAAIVNISIFCGVLFGRGNYALTGFVDATFFPGILSVLFGMLFWCTSKGVFDIFAYGFGSIFSRMNPDQTKVHKYRDYTDYVTTKRTQRAYAKPPLYPFYIIGGCFLIASIILFIILKTL